MSELIITIDGDDSEFEVRLIRDGKEDHVQFLPSVALVDNQLWSKWWKTFFGGSK